MASDLVNMQSIKLCIEKFNTIFSYVSYKIRSHGAQFLNYNLQYQDLSWELCATEYPLCPALEQNLDSQRFKDDREKNTFEKRLLIKRVTEFHDQGIRREASPTVIV
jgi:hypothetical protein